MFGSSKRKSRIVATVAAVFTAFGVGGLVSVQAFSGSSAASTIPAATRSAPAWMKGALAHVRAHYAANGHSTVPAVVNSNAASVTCGQIITASTTLEGNLNCLAGDGVIIGASNVTLNLNNFDISNSGEGNVGVELPSLYVLDTVEGGTISGWGETDIFLAGSDAVIKSLSAVGAEGYGIIAQGQNNQITSVNANLNSGVGIILQGRGNRLTNSIASQNGTNGAESLGDNVLQSDHLLNNGNDGYSGGGDILTGNVADGNGSGVAPGTGAGFYAAFPSTFRGNIADFNYGDGIDASDSFGPPTDSGGNLATGNLNTQPQCVGVVCSDHSVSG